MANTSIDAAPEGLDIFAGPEIDEPDLPDVSFTEEPVRPKPTHPSLDPNHALWNPKAYFSAQQKVIIVVPRSESDILSDPTGSSKAICHAGVNGYHLDIVKGVPTRVPQDFADYLVDIGAAYRYADIPDAI